MKSDFDIRYEELWAMGTDYVEKRCSNITTGMEALDDLLLQLYNKYASGEEYEDDRCITIWTTETLMSDHKKYFFSCLRRRYIDRIRADQAVIGRYNVCEEDEEDDDEEIEAREREAHGSLGSKREQGKDKFPELKSGDASLIISIHYSYIEDTPLTQLEEKECFIQQALKVFPLFVQSLTEEEQRKIEELLEVLAERQNVTTPIGVKRLIPAELKGSLALLERFIEAVVKSDE